MINTVVACLAFLLLYNATLILETISTVWSKIPKILYGTIR